MLDLESGSIKMKIHTIVKASVQVATYAIQAVKTMIQTGLETIFNHKYIFLEEEYLDLENVLTSSLK
jgi:hypothetical protein